MLISCCCAGLKGPWAWSLTQPPHVPLCSVAACSVEVQALLLKFVMACAATFLDNQVRNSTRTGGEKGERRGEAGGDSGPDVRTAHAASCNVVISQQCKQRAPSSPATELLCHEPCPHRTSCVLRLCSGWRV